MRIEEFPARLDPVNVFGSVIFGRQTRAELGERVDKLEAELQRWNNYTTSQTFLSGGEFSLADIAVFPVLMHFEALGFDFKEKTPALHDYMERCKLRPSVVKSGWVPTFIAFAQSRGLNQVLA